MPTVKDILMTKKINSNFGSKAYSMSILEVWKEDNAWCIVSFSNTSVKLCNVLSFVTWFFVMIFISLLSLQQVGYFCPLYIMPQLVDGWVVNDATSTFLWLCLLHYYWIDENTDDQLNCLLDYLLLTLYSCLYFSDGYTFEQNWWPLQMTLKFLQTLSYSLIMTFEFKISSASNF